MMLKALFRKQFAELTAQFFRNRRTGQPRTRAGGYGFLALMAVIFIAMGASFYFLAQGVFLAVPEEMSFLYYFVIGLIAIAIGLLGSVFNAYATIYNAKDNELLLSMPVPPKYIIFVRVVALSAMSALYEAVILVPAFLVRVIFRAVTPIVVVNYILLFIFVTLFVVTLTLALAFVVAAVARKVKRKSLVTVVTSIALLVLYYYLYFKAQNAMAALMTMTEVPKGIRTWLFLFYYMGLAAEGDAASMAIFAGATTLLFIVAYILLSVFFRRFTTARRSASVKGKVGDVRAARPGTALFKREMKKFLATPMYILNCGLGTLMMLLAGVLVFVKAEVLFAVKDALLSVFPRMDGGVFALVMVLLVASMNYLTAPSVSLEGKRIWVIRSLPVSTKDVFKAKIELHLSLTLLPAWFLTAAMVYAFRPGVLSSVMMFFAVTAYVLLAAEFGLTLNLLKPFLDWKNETVALKTGPSVLISVFGLFLFVLGLGVLFLPVSAVLADGYYILILFVLFSLGDALLMRWLGQGGVRRFEMLN